jgi:hypothetical protein
MSRRTEGTIPSPEGAARCVKTAGRRENARSDESFLHAAGESHDCVVPTKAPNKDLQRPAEGLEGRRSIQETSQAWADA